MTQPGCHHHQERCPYGMFCRTQIETAKSTGGWLQTYLQFEYLKPINDHCGTYLHPTSTTASMQKTSSLYNTIISNRMNEICRSGHRSLPLGRPIRMALLRVTHAVVSNVQYLPFLIIFMGALCNALTPVSHRHLITEAETCRLHQMGKHEPHPHIPGRQTSVPSPMSTC
jgi:hypothetical protein